MFHFSTDRLAGLDTMVLKITTPPKVPTLIPNHPLCHDTSIPARKQSRHRETRPPLADRTANLPPRPPHPTSSMLWPALSTMGEVDLLSPSQRAPCSPDVPFFRPLPPLPSASSLQLPSFLNLASPADTPLPYSATSLPASAPFRLSSSSSRRVAVRETENKKVFEGPQWIPAFHHPNSPYVPWSSPVRRRILPPPSPLPPSSLGLSSPCIRSGAVAPEPWASSTFSQAQKKSGKQKLASSWKSFKHSIKKGVKAVVSHLGKVGKSSRKLCISQDMLCIYDDTDPAAAAIQPNVTSDPMQSFAKAYSRGPRDSLVSFVSSDSRTLAAWLAADASHVVENTPREMSVEEYELMGSWLDLRHCDVGWVCGVQDCDVHTAGGSPASEYPSGLRMAMPFDSADLLPISRPPPKARPLSFPSGPFSAPPRFRSLPRLPCQSFDIHSAQEAKPGPPKNAEQCRIRSRELSMPGGWTFN